MTKAYKPSKHRDGYMSLHVGAQDVQNHNGTFSMQVVNGALTDPQTRNNVFTYIKRDVDAGQPVDIFFRPETVMKQVQRFREQGTGDPHPAGTLLALGNGTGTVGNGDGWVITFKHTGKDDNISSLTMFMTRNGDAPNSSLRVAITDITDVADEAIHTAPAGGIDQDLFNVDILDYWIAAPAVHHSIPFNDVPGAPGAPFKIDFGVGNNGTPTLIENHTYAIIITLERDGVEVGDVGLLGTDTISTDQMRLYFFDAGWGSPLLEDVGFIPYIKINTARNAAINQIHISADNSLNESRITSIDIIGDENLGDVVDNIPNIDGQLLNVSVCDNIYLPEGLDFHMLFEGKVKVPKGHVIHMVVFPSYTGELRVGFNYWVDLSGDKDKLK